MDPLQKLEATGGHWINGTGSLGSIFVTPTKWCLVAYESVEHAGPAHIKFSHVYPVLESLFRVRDQSKMMHLTNYRDVLALYQTQESLAQANELLLPKSLDGWTIV